MLRITIELLPLGSEIGKKLLGIAKISNTGSGSLTKGNYECRFEYVRGRLWKSCKVDEFPRQELPAWDLLYRALHKIVGGRNK
jgi:hypothetical protein